MLDKTIEFEIPAKELREYVDNNKAMSIPHSFILQSLDVTFEAWSESGMYRLTSSLKI